MRQLGFLKLFKNPPPAVSLGIVLVMLPFPFPIDAHSEAVKIPRVGVLTTLSLDRPHLRGLRDGLEASDYTIGKNLFLDMTQKKTLAELESVAHSFVGNRFDVLVTTSSLETIIAQRATRDIPIVFMPADDPIKRGFVKSYAQPGTNMTGLSYFRDLEYSGKLLELLKELAPNLNAVTVISDGRRSEQNFADQLASIRRVAAYLNIRYTEKLASNKAEVLAILSGMGRGRDKGVLLNCTTLFADLKNIAALAQQRGIPLQGCSARAVSEDGALFSYAPDFYQIGRRGAWYVERILNGAKPQEMPVEAPRKFAFVINLSTANAIGLEIPPEVLQRADRVIE